MACWLKTGVAKQEQSKVCTSGILPGFPTPAPAPIPTPSPGKGCPGTEFDACQCKYNGAVPNDRTLPHLWHLDADPSERVDLANSTDPVVVAKLPPKLLL